MRKFDEELRELLQTRLDARHMEGMVDDRQARLELDDIRNSVLEHRFDVYQDWLKNGSLWLEW